MKPSRLLAAVVLCSLLRAGARAFDEARTDAGKKPVPQPRLKTGGVGTPTDPFAGSALQAQSKTAKGTGSDAAGPQPAPCDPKKDKACKTPPAETHGKQAPAKPKAQVRPRGKNSR